MCAGFGFAFGPFLTGFLSSVLLLDWQDISLVFGGLALLCGCVTLLFLRDIKESPAESAVPPDTTLLRGEGSGLSSATAGGCSPKHPGLWGLSRGLWGFLVFITLVAGVRDISMWTILDISDFYVTGIRSEPLTTAWILFFMYLPGIFTQPIVAGLSDRIGRRVLSVIVLVGYGCSLVCAAIVPFGFLILPYIFMGGTQSPSTPLMEAFVADYTTPRTRGVIFGIYITAITGIGALGPLFGGIILDAFGRTAGSFRALIAGMGILVCLGGIAMIFSVRVCRALGLQPETAGGLSEKKERTA